MITTAIDKNKNRRQKTLRSIMVLYKLLSRKVPEGLYDSITDVIDGAKEFFENDELIVFLNSKEQLIIKIKEQKIVI